MVAVMTHSCFASCLSFFVLSAAWFGRRAEYFVQKE